MSYLVYIVSASGPYAEKSLDSRFFSVYPMNLSSLEEK